MDPAFYLKAGALFGEVVTDDKQLKEEGDSNAMDRSVRTNGGARVVWDRLQQEQHDWK
jgi:hypothetical protein